MYRLLLQRIDGAVLGFGCQPFGQGLYLELMALAGGVDHDVLVAVLRAGFIVHVAVPSEVLLRIQIPAQRAAVNECHPRCG